MAHMAKNHLVAIVVGLILFGQTLKVITPIMLEWLELSTQRGGVKGEDVQLCWAKTILWRQTSMFCLFFIQLKCAGLHTESTTRDSHTI
jgi:hypothetical protein